MVFIAVDWRTSELVIIKPSETPLPKPTDWISRVPHRSFLSTNN
ncbi:protein of unknown function [Xenorhabdus bovienii]|uniref:Uncharacterized protein n=1 Tax=Xenorhabdus bovienii TaxID=40576 RepID=A0A0B6XBA6_XENBV|nr:protein of unknown function [Xenorhabdus bovienii]